MTSRAYVLIRTAADKTREVFQVLLDSSVVEHVDVITGPYDIIAIVEAPDNDAVMDAVINDFRYVEGIIDTTTCFTVRVVR